MPTLRDRGALHLVAGKCKGNALLALALIQGAAAAASQGGDARDSLSRLRYGCMVAAVAPVPYMTEAQRLMRAQGGHGVCKTADSFRSSVRGCTHLMEESHLAEDTILRVRPTVAWTELPDGAVLFAPESEVYYSMNQVAAAIWELIAKADLTLDALCEQIQLRFPDENAVEIRNDVKELLQDLAANGLLIEGAAAQVA